MYVQDYTKGQYSLQTYGPTTPQGNWECITEKNNGTNPLANFGTMTFTGCDGLNGGNNYWYSLIGSGNVQCYVPVNGSGQFLMDVSGISNGDTFSVRWLRGS